MKTVLKYAPWLAIAAMLLFAGDAIGKKVRGIPEAITNTVIQTVAPAEYTAILEDYALPEGGLRGFIEGIEERNPAVIIRTDTLVPPPDTVIRFLSVGDDGNLTVEILTDTIIQVDTLAQTDTLYVPQVRTGINVADCDEGFTVQAGQVLCNRARLGHLYLGPSASLKNAGAFLLWEPSYRSLWRFEAGYVFPYERDLGDHFDVRVSRFIRIF